MGSIILGLAWALAVGFAIGVPLAKLGRTSAVMNVFLVGLGLAVAGFYANRSKDLVPGGLLRESIPFFLAGCTIGVGLAIFAIWTDLDNYRARFDLAWRALKGHESSPRTYLEPATVAALLDANIDEALFNPPIDRPQELAEWAERTRLLVSAAVQDRRIAWDEIDRMQAALDTLDVPFVATAEIRQRIGAQSTSADELHAAAVTRMVGFQRLGIGVIIVGLTIVCVGVWRVLFADVEVKRGEFVAPVAGIVFNVVGGGLILFHRAAATTAREYYDRKQNQDNLLTALELMTNHVMKDKTVDLMPGLIEKLYAMPSVKPLSETELKIDEQRKLV